MVFINQIFLGLCMSNWLQLLAPGFQCSSSKHGRTEQAQRETRCLMGTHISGICQSGKDEEVKNWETRGAFLQATFKIQFLLTLLHCNWTPSPGGCNIYSIRCKCLVVYLHPSTRIIGSHLGVIFLSPLFTHQGHLAMSGDNSSCHSWWWRGLLWAASG